jgi:hypothetical protein
MTPLVDHAVKKVFGQFLYFVSFKLKSFRTIYPLIYVGVDGPLTD